jgi:hypothetical protein
MIPVIRLGIEQRLITFEDRRIDGTHRQKKAFLLVQRTTSQNEVCVDLTDPGFVVRFSFELENFASKHGHNAAWFLAVTVSMDSEENVRHVKNPIQDEAKIGPWRIAPSFDWGQAARIYDGGRWIPGHHQLPHRHAKSCDPAVSSTRNVVLTSFSRAAGATHEARFFPYCRLLPPREIGW